ncbi:small ribosomal subunit protein eS8-like [Musca autumnalis]|uniref:small ribosomal subunit protein eS8-like n=1 Tax=Musca autumnalis TaxID=221902 RepID=UPI003CE765A8
MDLQNTENTENGNFAWASVGIARKTSIADIVYNPSSNELVRTKSLVKNTIVVIDATPFRQWYESHYILPLGRKRNPKQQQMKDDNDVLTKKRGEKTMKNYLERQKYTKVEQALEDQFVYGRLLACVSSRPFQCGRADGYILEGKELEFYLKKINSKK